MQNKRKLLYVYDKLSHEGARENQHNWEEEEHRVKTKDALAVNRQIV